MESLDNSLQENLNNGVHTDSNESLGLTETEKEFQKERRMVTLPALKVKNTVMYVNPIFEGKIPFDIQSGESTDLAVFLTPNPSIYPEEEVENVIIPPEKVSGRSIVLENNLFRDKSGKLYRDVDLKGVGCFLKIPPDDTCVVGEVRKRSLDPNQAKGMQDYRIAINDKENTEMFINKGLRTHRVIAIIDLAEIIDKEGNKISTEEAKRRGIISYSMRPVIEMRAFGTRERMDYLHVSEDKENETRRAKLALNDAIELVARELHKDPSEFLLDDYLEFFARTLGEQVAKIRNLGAYHGHLHSQNITLDCCITDFEGVFSVEKLFSTTNKPYEELKKRLGEEKLTPEIVYKSEFDVARISLDGFLHDVYKLTGEMEVENIQKILSVFEEEYKNKSL